MSGGPPERRLRPPSRELPRHRRPRLSTAGKSQVTPGVVGRVGLSSSPADVGPATQMSDYLPSLRTALYVGGSLAAAAALLGLYRSYTAWLGRPRDERNGKRRFDDSRVLNDHDDQKLQTCGRDGLPRDTPVFERPTPTKPTKRTKWSGSGFDESLKAAQKKLKETAGQTDPHINKTQHRDDDAMELFKELTQQGYSGKWNVPVNPKDTAHSVQVRIKAARFIHEYTMQRHAWHLEDTVHRRWDEWLDYKHLGVKGTKTLFEGQDRYEALELRFFWLMRSMIKVSTSPRWPNLRLLKMLESLHDDILRSRRPRDSEPGTVTYLTTSFKVHCLLGEWGGPHADPARGAFHVGRALLECKGGTRAYEAMSRAAKERPSKRPDYDRFYQGFLGTWWKDLEGHSYKGPAFSLSADKKWSIDSLSATRSDVETHGDTTEGQIVLKEPNEIYRFGALAQVALQLAGEKGKPPPETLLVGYWSPSKLHLKGNTQYRTDAATIGYTLELTRKTGSWAGTLRSRAGPSGGKGSERREYTVEAKLTAPHS